MRWLTVALAVFALALFGVGCGGGDDESSGDSGITVLTDTTETEDTTTTDETTDATETDGSGSFASGDCVELASAAAAFGQAFSGTGGDNDDISKLYEELADKAPDEIKGDLATVASAWTEIAAALEKLDLQPGEVPNAAQLQEYQQAIASVSNAEVTAASERLSAWSDENC